MSFENIKELFNELDDILKNDFITENQLRHAEETIRYIQLDLYSMMDKSLKDKYMEKIREYQEKVNQARKNNLVGGKSNISNITSNNENDIETEQMKQLDMLQNSLRKLYQCEDDGINTLKNLNDQGEKIKAMKPKLQKVDNDLNRSNRLLDRMKQWWRG